MLLRLILSLLAIASFYVAVGQKGCNERVQQHAAVLASRGKYHKAISLLQHSVQRQPQCVQSFIRLSDLYYRVGNPMMAIGCCNQAISIDNAEGVSATIFLQKQMLFYKNDSMALELLQTVLKNTNLANVQRGKLQNEYLDLYTKLSMLAKPNTAAIFNLGDSVNTAMHQYYPTCDASGNTVLFTGVEKDVNEDFLYTIYDSCTGWSKARNIGYPPNTSAPDGSAKWSNDARYLFYTRCNTFSENGYDAGGCDLMYSFRQNNGEWSGPQLFGATINSSDYEGQPCLSSDGTTLYFVSNRKGGLGGMDIYKSQFLSGYWQEPVNLGSTINTGGDEQNPFMHADNKHLYFASNGHRGAGSNDIFVATINTDSSWAKPINLGYPINSPSDENSICVTASGDKAYFASDRGGGMGKFDIYTTILPQYARAVGSVCVLGIVKDKYTREGLKQKRIIVTDTASGHSAYYISNEGDGSYSFAVPANAYFRITIKQEDDYQLYESVVDARKAEGNVLGKDILIKQLYVVDTIAHTFFASHDFADTNLRYLGMAHKQWVQEASDSVMLYINAKSNKFIDTSFLAIACFSEEGRLAYLKHTDSLAAVKEILLLQHVLFYKKYLMQCGYKDNQIVLNSIVETIDKKQLLNIETVVVEYY